MTSTGTAQLTRAEDAYAHLASFAKGDVVDVTWPGGSLAGTVIVPQRHDGNDMARSYLGVRGSRGAAVVTVADLLDRERTITLQNEAARGNVRYFDAAGYAAQNG